ncbi:MAG: TIGR04076 family protein [Candidatus Thermoplasmatota archaeon]|nr:TIGR04076 family protein [Candidatus Thermoplasmatota archaeon]MBS3790010.1 TIGR04076 family protein [Candidatus Thermoplasmatota archaeon]
MLEIEVHKIEGDCPVFEEGDRMIVDDPELDLEKTDAVCTHALDTLLHYTTALENGVSPIDLGLSKSSEDTAFLQCVDPGKEYTDGGTVIFKCKID